VAYAMKAQDLPFSTASRARLIVTASTAPMGEASSESAVIDRCSMASGWRRYRIPTMTGLPPNRQGAHGHDPDKPPQRALLIPGAEAAS